MTQPLITTTADDTAVCLIPVVELEPCKFQCEGRISPTHLEPDDAWARYWSDSLADSGIVGLAPVRPGAWHVPTAQLTDPDVLEKIIRVHFAPYRDEDPAEEIDPDDLLAFSGGYALCVGGDVKYVPRCCGDLGDIDNWESAAAYTDTTDKMVWVGHPWLLVRFDGTHLLFSESEPEAATALPVYCAVAPAKMEAAVRQAERELGAFAALLVPVLENSIGAKRAGEIAETLAAC